MSNPGTDRRIRKLSLTVSDLSQSRPIAGVIEEALRLASVPGESEGRHYHFRRLNLGKIHRQESSSLIALRLENEFLRLASEAVHIDDARAPHSEAIYFHSPVEPLRLALRRLVRGQPIDTWFLRAVRPEFPLTATPAQVLQGVLEASAQLPGGVVNTAYLLDETLFRSELELLLPWLTKEAVAVPMPEFESATRAPAPTQRPQLSPSWMRVVQRAIELWEPTDARCAWLAWIALVAQSPARLADPELPSVAVAVTQAIATAQSPSSKPQGDKPAPQQEWGTEHRPFLTQEAKGDYGARVQTTPDLDAAHPESSSSQSPLARPAESDDFPTTYSSHSGLFFLLRVLEHLGIEEFLHTHSSLADINFPWLALRGLARHLRVDEDDPHLSIAPPVRAESLPSQIMVAMPVRWRTLLGERLAADRAEITIPSLVRLWVAAVRRWLWRYGELRLSEVTHKRGQVFFYARPQVDVKLLLHEVDIRIRRLGLDLDPGWVAWLGLIVRFHYERSLGDDRGT